MSIQQITATLAAALQREYAVRKLHTFLRLYAWPVLEPATPFSDNWHIGAICEHLEAIAHGEIKRLIINMPFRSLKSTIVSQTFPAWEWLSNPSLQYLTASYSRDVATRDAVASRRIIESALYQSHFADRFQMTSDQNVKTRYENNRRGMRTVTSTDSAGTGFGGNRVIVDDPISAKEADSEPARLGSIEWWKGTTATRMNCPETDALILVHQRLHEQDLTGHVLAEEKGWVHLILPMRYEQEHTKTTILGFVDPRKEEGELLHPKRLSEDTVREMESRLGAYHTAAQLQQRPASRGGQIFFAKDWKYYKVLPALDDMVMSVDCTFKDTKNADYVGLHVWGRKGADKYLLYRKRERLGFAATVAAVRAVYAKFPQCIAVLIEDKANGAAVIETIKQQIAGVLPIEPEGGKVARAYAMQPEHQAGNIWIPDPSLDADIDTFVTECSSFPNGPHDDEVDAMTQAINWYRRRESTSGFYNFVKEQAAAQRTADERPRSSFFG